MFKQTLNPLTSKVNILNTTSSTSSPSLLSIISSSSPDLVLLCGDGASPLLFHSAVAQSHFPVIFNVFQVILNINFILIFLVIILCSLIIMVTITIQELMALSGPSLYWNESAQVAINLPSSSSSLSSVSSLPSLSSPGGDQPALRLLRPPHPPPLLHLLKPALRLPWQGAG